jgi:hypothetical protein
MDLTRIPIAIVITKAQGVRRFMVVVEGEK